MKSTPLPKGGLIYQAYRKEDNFLVSFYKKRYLYFLKIGIGNYTKLETKVTETLLRTTANRLDQLIQGETTAENSSFGHLKRRELYNPKKLFNSNRLFGWNNTGEFKYADLDFEQRHSIDCPTMIQETYIDKYTTAYHSIREYKEYE